MAFDIKTYIRRRVTVVYQVSVSREKSLEAIRDFFFRAMLSGYASSGKQKIQHYPRCKIFSFSEGDLTLVDDWCVNSDSQKSTGTTRIFFKDNPVWSMSYGGYYPEEAIPLLKKALGIAYETNRFLGGRGVGYAENGLFYVNNPVSNSFSQFRGREEIRLGENGKTIGFHDYSGMSLLSDQ